MHMCTGCYFPIAKPGLCAPCAKSAIHEATPKDPGCEQCGLKTWGTSGLCLICLDRRLANTRQAQAPVAPVAAKATRPCWHAYHMTMARTASLRASCDRMAVGAVVVRANRILATGYNGAPSGLPTCDQAGHRMEDVAGRQSCTRTVHAEVNAILAAAKFGVALDGAILYCTHAPCAYCARLIIAAGISAVIYEAGYAAPGLDELKQAGLAVKQLAEVTHG